MSFFLQSTGWGRKTQISWVSHFPTGEILEQTGRQRPQFNINIWVTFYVLLLRVAAFFVLGKEIFCSNKGFLDSTRSFLVLNPLVSSEETVETSRERIFFFFKDYWWTVSWGLHPGPEDLHSQTAQGVKNLPAVQETQVRSPGREDPLGVGMAAHPSILA